MEEAEIRRKEAEGLLDLARHSNADCVRADKELDRKIEALEQDRLLDKIALLKIRQSEVTDELHSMDRSLLQTEIYLQVSNHIFIYFFYRLDHLSLSHLLLRHLCFPLSSCSPPHSSPTFSPSTTLPPPFSRQGPL